MSNPAWAQTPGFRDPLTYEDLHRAIEAVELYGGVKPAAETLGWTEQKLQHRINTAREEGMFPPSTPRNLKPRPQDFGYKRHMFIPDTQTRPGAPTDHIAWVAQAIALRRSPSMPMPRRYDDVAASWCAAYESGESVWKIGARYGVGGQSVWNYLKRHGVARRAGEAAIRKEPIRLDAFSDLSEPAAAYWLGMLYADGSMTRNGADHWQVGLTAHLSPFGEVVFCLWFFGFAFTATCLAGKGSFVFGGIARGKGGRGHGVDLFRVLAQLVSRLVLGIENASRV